MSSKLSFKKYWEKTPKKWRKIGDTILAISTFLATGGLFEMDALKEILTPNQVKNLVMFIIGFGVVGKFLTNFFTEDEELS